MTPPERWPSLPEHVPALPDPVWPQVDRAPHGGPPYGGPGTPPFTGFDFSVNTNPYGPAPSLVRALRGADHAAYPDPGYHAVRAALAEWHSAEWGGQGWPGIGPDGVALGVGASELLHRLARAFLPPGGGTGVLSLHAPFGEFARAAQLCGARVEQVTEPSRALRGGRLRGDGLPEGTRLVYLGYPHNPTGHLPEPGELSALLNACAECRALVVLDEAYAPFVPLPAPPPHPQLVRLQSPGKAYGLVGARPAYALAAPEVVARLDNLAPAWALPASTAAVLAELPGAADFLAATRLALQGHARDLAAELEDLGELRWRPGLPFMQLKVEDAAALAAALLRRGVRVRGCASYGEPQWIRVSARLPEQNRVLVTALRAELGGAAGGERWAERS